MEQGPEPKISLVEIILIAPYLLIIDIIEIALAFFALDDFWIGDVLAAPVAMWLWFRGVNATRYASMAVLELIPWVGDLPLLTIGFFMTVYLDRHPELEAAVQKTTGKTAAVKGKLAPRGRGGVSAQKPMASRPARGAREEALPSAVQAPASAGGTAPQEREPRRGNAEPGTEEAEIRVFGGQPEPLSKYETERIVSPPEMTDVQGPPKKERSEKNG